MDNMEKLVRELLADDSIWLHKGRSIDFKSSFLNDVAEVYETQGMGAAEVFLADKTKKDGPRAYALLRVLKYFKKYPEVIAAREKGRLIIKTLDALKKLED